MFKAPGRTPTLSVSLAQLFSANVVGLELNRPQNYRALQQQYGTSAWVYIATRRKARDLTAAPFVFTIPARDATGAPKKPKPKFKRKGFSSDDEDRERLAPEHPLNQLLGSSGRPNPWLTVVDLLTFTSLFLDLTGNAFWLKFRNGPDGEPVELYPVNPINVRIFTSHENMVDHYEVFHNGGVFEFRREDMIHFRLPNPIMVGGSAVPTPWGLGPLEAAWQLVVTDDDAVTWNRNLVKNDGRPSGMLMSDMDIGPEEAQTAAERYRQTFGGPAGAGKVLVLGKNLKYVRLGDTPKDLDYVKARNMLREQILAAFGLNSAVLGLAQGDIGRRREQIQDYWEGTIVATSQADICSSITFGLCKDFGDQIEAAQDFSDVRALQENETERVQYVEKYWGMGVSMARLNRRFNLGFDPEPGDDVAYVPIGVQTAEAAALPPEPVPAALPLAPGNAPAPASVPAVSPEKLLQDLEILAAAVEAARTKQAEAAR